MMEKPEIVKQIEDHAMSHNMGTKWVVLMDDKEMYALQDYARDFFLNTLRSGPEMKKPDFTEMHYHGVTFYPRLKTESKFTQIQ